MLDNKCPGNNAGIYINKDTSKMDNISTGNISHPRPKTFMEARGIQPAAAPRTIAHHTPKKAATNTHMKALSEKAHAVSIDDREDRLTRVLDYLQQVRIATRRDIDRVSGYTPGVSHNYVLERMYKRRLIDRIENIDSSQNLYALTAKGDSFCTAPTGLPPMTTFDWQNASQQEHRLGVARLMSVLLSPAPLPEGMTKNTKLQTLLLQGHYVLLGEPLINARYAEMFGKKAVPDADSLNTLYTLPEDGEGRYVLYRQAWWYTVPPYIQGSTNAAPITDLAGEEQSPYSTQEPTGEFVKKHPADAVLATPTTQRGKAVAIEIERYAKPAADYESTMSRYGSVFGRERFRFVLWACASRQIEEAVIKAAGKTGTTNMITTLVYGTGANRFGSFIRGNDFYIM